MLKNINVSGSAYLIVSFVTAYTLLVLFKLIKNKEEKVFSIATILAIILNLYANSVSGAVHMHYFISFIPIMAMIVSLTITLFDKIKINKNIKIIIMAIIVIVLGIKPCHDYISYCKRKNTDDNKQNLPQNVITPKKFSNIIDNYIQANSTESDFVQLIGGKMESVGANFRTERLAASKYSYLPLWDTFTKERKAKMTNELIEEIKRTNPKLILICDTNKEEFYSLIEDKDDWSNFISNNYNKDEDTIIFYTVFKRKVENSEK